MTEGLLSDSDNNSVVQLSGIDFIGKSERAHQP